MELTGEQYGIIRNVTKKATIQLPCNTVIITPPAPLLSQEGERAGQIYCLNLPKTMIEASLPLG